MTNYAHVVLFALFFMMTSAQFATLQVSHGSALARAALITLAMGALVELAQGVTSRGNCRLRDLIPDSAGILLGATAIILWHRARRWLSMRKSALPRNGKRFRAG